MIEVIELYATEYTMLFSMHFMDFAYWINEPNQMNKLIGLGWVALYVFISVAHAKLAE